MENPVVGIIKNVNVGEGMVSRDISANGIGVAGISNESECIQAQIQSAIAHHQAGRLTQAEDVYRSVLNVNPKHPDALHLLGVIAYQCGKNTSAIELISKSINVAPENAAAYSNLGLALGAIGRLDDSIACYQKALTLDSEYQDALHNLALAYAKKADVVLMRDCLDRLYRVAPNDYGVLLTYLSLMNEHMFYAVGLDMADKALAAFPDSAEFHCQRGVSLSGLLRNDEAFYAFQTARKLNPTLSVAHFNAGKLLYDAGAIDQAVIALDAAIENDPGMGEAYGLRVNARRPEAGDVLWERLTAALPLIETRGAKSKYLFHSALGQAYEHVKAFDDSFFHYEESARIFRESNVCDFGKIRSAFENLHKNFTKELFSQMAVNPSSEPVMPIFILGMPRSGSTLIEQILASHSLIADGGELDFLEKSLNGLILPNNMILHVDGRQGTNYSENIKATPLEVAHRYLSELNCFRKNNSQLYVTDKMPGNFKKLGFISAIFPRAKIIHCRRDPVDNCLSIFFTQFARGHEWSKDLRTIGEYYRLYYELMEHWRKILPLGAFYDLDYESIVADPEREAKKVLSYIGVPWESGCLEFHKSERRVSTASAAQVRKPIYNTSVKRWRPFAHHLRELFVALGPLAPEFVVPEIR